MQDTYNVHKVSRHQLTECPTPALTLQLHYNSGPQGLNKVHSDIYYGVEHTLWF